MNIGDSWNGWKIDSLLGSGSYGKVYRIVREEFGNVYESALKVIVIPEHPSDIDPLKLSGMDDESITSYYKSVIKGIISEFTIMSKMRGHSNIVSYEDHSVRELQDEFGWEICIRMELLTPLYKYIKQNEFTKGDVVRLGIDICSALEMCERNNIVHRDIKPANIFVSGQGTFKLGDFGVARYVEKTTAGMSRKGTFSYMAPEVYNENPYNNTVDIYSLGIVMYRFTNNNRGPFMPPYPDKITMDDSEIANRRRLKGESLPPPCNAGQALSGIILKACSYDPASRYQSAAEMKYDLEQLLSQDSSNDEQVMISSSGSAVTSTSNPAKGEKDPQVIESTETMAQPAVVPHKKSKAPLIGIAAVLLIIIIGVGAFIALGGKEANDTQDTEYVSTGVSDGAGNMVYDHHGISITIPEEMSEEPGSAFAYEDDEYEYWYRYWYMDNEKSEEYPQMSVEVRRVGVADDSVAAEAYQTGAETIVNDYLVDNFETYERDFNGERDNFARGPVNIDGVECWMISYDQHRSDEDERKDSESVRTTRLYIPVDSLGQLTEVIIEYVNDNDDDTESLLKYADIWDSVMESIHLTAEN